MKYDPENFKMIIGGQEVKGFSILEDTKHKAVPNGAGDYTFICPKMDKKDLGFMNYWSYRSLLGKYFTCPYCRERVTL